MDEFAVEKGLGGWEIGMEIVERNYRLGLHLGQSLKYYVLFSRIDIIKNAYL